MNQKVSKGAMLKEMSMEVEKLRADLIATREKNGVYMSLENYEASELERVQLRAQVRRRHQLYGFLFFLTQWASCHRRFLSCLC